MGLEHAWCYRGPSPGHRDCESDELTTVHYRARYDSSVTFQDLHARINSDNRLTYERQEESGMTSVLMIGSVQLLAPFQMMLVQRSNCWPLYGEWLNTTAPVTDCERKTFANWKCMKPLMPYMKMYETVNAIHIVAQPLVNAFEYSITFSTFSTTMSAVLRLW